MTTRRKNSDPDPDPITLADPEPDRPAVPTSIGLTLVRMSGGRRFLDVMTISLDELAHVAIGANSRGPNGYGLISFQGRMFSHIGPFVPESNAQEPFRGFPMYVEV